MSPRPLPETIWRSPDGEIVSCVEKLKVLRENLEEIQQLCQDALEDAVLMVTGYSPMLVAREGRVRETERDATDETIRWLHRGGRYRVAMAIM